VCDNNQYGMSMAAEKSMNIRHVAERACAYGIPGVTVDGNNVLAVYHAVKQAVERARAGDGISLVENLTYRWRGHSKSDRNLYRTQEEIREWQEMNDPIVRFSKLLLGCEQITREEIDRIDRDCKQAIEQAAAKALAFPDPDPTSLEAEVYAP
jgi:pyruvate dehydrogenase E1 component alpha subunit